MNRVRFLYFVYFIWAMVKCELDLSLWHLTPQGIWVACLALCYSENEISPVNYASSSECCGTLRDPRSISDADMYSLLPYTCMHTQWHTLNHELCSSAAPLEAESYAKIVQAPVSVMSFMVLMI